jgi:penicillin-binding protein 2
MNRFQDYKNLVFSRRSFILLAAKSVIIFILMIRLFFLQVINSKLYRTLSEKNRIKFFLLEPKRGFIKDSENVLLSENKINYQLYFYKQLNKDYETTLSKAMTIVNMTWQEKQESIKAVKNSSYLYPTLIKDNLNWSEVSKIESAGQTLEGAYVNKGYIRYYPMKKAFAHVLGYVGIPTPEEVSEYQLYRAGGFRIGKTGIEKISNKDLIGEFGLKKVEVNAYRTVVRELEQESSVRGKDVNITINAKLQNHVYGLLPENGSSAVVLDAKTGSVLSMVSKPSFDPNLFSTPVSQEEWNYLIKNKQHPLTNRTISQLYPPGSSWKIITSLAILRSGIDPNKTVYCSGSMNVGTQTYKCWKEHGHGHVDLAGALRHSCNVYFYEMGLASGIDNIQKSADALGFGRKTGIELAGEVSGINPGRNWKDKTYKNKWLVGDTANSSIGQGYNLVTPLQLATMISSVSTGKIVKPHIYPTAEELAFEDLTIQQGHIATIKSNLEEVFNHPKGAGYNLRIKQPELALAGKTGTAQVISGDTINARNRQIRSHSLFVGYAPIHDPKYAVAIVAENAGWGMGTAGPAGVSILHFAQTKL